MRSSSSATGLMRRAALFSLLVALPARAQQPPAGDSAARPSQQGSLSASPFGVPMNATKADLRGIAKLEPLEEPGLYKLSGVPKPHSDFETYVVWVSDALGLCKFTAIGKTIETSVYGTELKQHFESIDEALQERYGRRKKVDFLRSGSIWNDPEDWMMALLKKERYLSSFWDAEEKSTLPSGIHSVVLQTYALSTESGYVNISYESPKVTACAAEEKKKKSSVF